MFRKIAIVLGGAAVMVVLPFAALAMTGPVAAEDVGTSDATVLQEQVQVQSQVQVQNQVRIQDPTAAEDPVATQEQTATQQRLREHAETGMPEGTEPVRQRLQLHEPGTGLDDGATMGSGQRNGNGPSDDAARNGDGTGECTNDGGPIGSGPHAGQQGGNGSGN